MELIQNQLKQLESLHVEVRKEPDFEPFWEETVSQCREQILEVERRRVDYPVKDWEVYEILFSGLDGTRILGWYILPHRLVAEGRKLPCMVFYHGASGWRSFPHAYGTWLAMGHAVLCYDFRLQGGLTGSASGFPEGCRALSWYTLGLLNPRESYLYHVITDAVRAVEVARQMPEIDPGKVWLNGVSQGGGMVLTVASLQRERVCLACADVPSACWIEKRIFDRAGGFGQIANFLRNHPDKIDDVCRCLSYFDNVNLAPWITCPTLVSVGLKDPICPPENVYAACNKIQSELKICPYPFGEHDGGHAVHEDTKLHFVAEHIS